MVGERAFRVTGGGFWQVHPGAAATLLDAVLDGLDPQPGESALDLYCGVGLFAAELAERVGPTGRVTAVESDRVAVEDARHNLADLPQVRVERGRVDHVLRRLRLRPGRPRRARPAALGRRPRGRRPAVAGRGPAGSPTSPATRRRWPATSRCFGERGYRLAGLRAFDLFPMTAPRRVRGGAGASGQLIGEPDVRGQRRVLVCVLCTKPRSPCPPS